MDRVGLEPTYCFLFYARAALSVELSVRFQRFEQDAAPVVTNWTRTSNRTITSGAGIPSLTLLVY